MMCCDGFCGKHAVPLHIPGPEDNPTACRKKNSRYMTRPVVPLRRNYPDCVNTGEVLGGSNFIIQVVITTPPEEVCPSFEPKW